MAREDILGRQVDQSILDNPPLHRDRQSFAERPSQSLFDDWEDLITHDVRTEPIVNIVAAWSLSQLLRRTNDKYP